MELRKRIKINEDWSFTGPSGRTQRVDLPHTWNNIDGQDGGNDYWRGTCIYCKSFPKPDFTADQRVYLEFQGVNASAKVELNGNLVGGHNGGYSTFRWDITELLSDANVLTVHVDNGVNDRVYPQKADFTFYGGIYRDVSLIIVNKRHFDLDHLGGPGIMVTAKPVENYSRGEVQVKTWRNCEEGQVHISILDGLGKEVAAADMANGKLDVPNVQLWNGVKSPYLYTAVATLDIDGKKVDQISTRFGVRDFHVDAREGFFLNGRSYPLRGVSRHQDWKGIGNAITCKHHDADMALIREMGANTIRLAHCTTSISMTCATSTGWWCGQRSPTSLSICPVAAAIPSVRPRSWSSKTITTRLLWYGVYPMRSPFLPRTRWICWTTTECSTTFTTRWIPPG